MGWLVVADAPFLYVLGAQLATLEASSKFPPTLLVGVLRESSLHSLFRGCLEVCHIGLVLHALRALRRLFAAMPKENPCAVENLKLVPNE
eukprot:5856684-Amphidinium_carterae.1